MAFIGITTARLRANELNPRSFAAWCQAVLERSVAAVEMAGGTAVTSHGPGLLATFTGVDHASHAWRAMRDCCVIHEVPLKIGLCAGSFHLGTIRIGSQRQSPDVFGIAVTTALALADWISSNPARPPSDHGIAWRGPRPKEVPAPDTQEDTLELDQQR